MPLLGRDLLADDDVEGVARGQRGRLERTLDRVVVGDGDHAEAKLRGDHRLEIAALFRKISCDPVGGQRRLELTTLEGGCAQPALHVGLSFEVIRFGVELQRALKHTVGARGIPLRPDDVRKIGEVGGLSILVVKPLVDLERLAKIQLGLLHIALGQRDDAEIAKCDRTLGLVFLEPGNLLQRAQGFLVIADAQVERAEKVVRV